jgi:hypothetical protein
MQKTTEYYRPNLRIKIPVDKNNQEPQVKTATVILDYIFRLFGCIKAKVTPQQL